MGAISSEMGVFVAFRQMGGLYRAGGVGLFATISSIACFAALFSSLSLTVSHGAARAAASSIYDIFPLSIAHTIAWPLYDTLVRDSSSHLPILLAIILVSTALNVRGYFQSLSSANNDYGPARLSSIAWIFTMLLTLVVNSLLLLVGVCAPVAEQFMKAHLHIATFDLRKWEMLFVLLIGLLGAAYSAMLMRISAPYAPTLPGALLCGAGWSLSAYLVGFGARYAIEGSTAYLLLVGMLAGIVLHVAATSSVLLGASFNRARDQGRDKFYWRSA